MPDLSPLTASFTSTTTSGRKGVHGAFNVSVRGTFTATIVAERSFDDGATWGIVKTYNSETEDNGVEPEHGVLYRLRCAAYTSGTATARLGAGTNEFMP
jgi:hypothetical protein